MEVVQIKPFGRVRTQIVMRDKSREGKSSRVVNRAEHIEVI